MAREKKVFTDYGEVARLWARKSQHEAEYRGGKMYFRGDTIYSYGSHFEIAKHVQNSTGENAVLFTTSTYSNTTRDQCAVVLGAVRGKVIYCKSPDASEEKNIAYFLSEVEECIEQIKKKANRKFEHRLQELKMNAHRLRDYMEFFGIEIPFELQVKLTFIESGDVVNKLRNN